MSTEKKIYMSTDYTGEAIAPHQQFVTDAEGNSKWEERTHWEVSSGASTILVNNVSINLSNSPNIENAFTMPTDFIEGKIYRVIFNGTAYECIAYIIPGPNVAGIGSAGRLNGPVGNDDGKGEPFLIFSMGGGATTFFYASLGTHTVSISDSGKAIYKLDEKYLPYNNSNIINGSSTSSVRSIGSTKEGAQIGQNEFYKIGEYATAFGYNTRAIGINSFVEGVNTTASGISSHAEGGSTTASGNSSHAEGQGAKAENIAAHAEGAYTTASGQDSHAEGAYTTASGQDSHAEGTNTTASGNSSHAEGWFTLASSQYQHVQGQANIEDTTNVYAHIVGNGNPSVRSNAHTLDWSGNAWFKGSVYIGGTGQTDTAATKILPAKLVSTETTPTTNDTICWLYE